MKRTLLLLAACGSHGGAATDIDAPLATSDGPDHLGDAPTTPDGGAAQPTIFTIVLENQDYAEIVGSANAPYINSLIADYGLATNYKDTGHPSLPNYLHMISGDNQYPGIVDVGPNFVWFPADKPNLATQLEAASIPWRSYQESIPAPCTLTDSGEFATRHDPFLYFKDQQMGANNLCADTNVDYGQFAGDLASNGYRYMWITPNLIDDGHDPQTDPVTGLEDADTWLSTNVPAILASAGYGAGGVVFITWDEAEGRNNDDPDKIPMIVISKRLKQPGMQVATAYTHASYLAAVEDMLGLSRLATVTTAPSLLPDFMQ